MGSICLVSAQRKAYRLLKIVNATTVKISKCYSEEKNAYFRVKNAWASLPYGGFCYIMSTQQYLMV